MNNDRIAPPKKEVFFYVTSESHFDGASNRPGIEH